MKKIFELIRINWKSYMAYLLSAVMVFQIILPAIGSLTMISAKAEERVGVKTVNMLTDSHITKGNAAAFQKAVMTIGETGVLDDVATTSIKIETALTSSEGETLADKIDEIINTDGSGLEAFALANSDSYNIGYNAWDSTDQSERPNIILAALALIDGQLESSTAPAILLLQAFLQSKINAGEIVAPSVTLQLPKELSFEDGYLGVDHEIETKFEGYNIAKYRVTQSAANQPYTLTLTYNYVVFAATSATAGFSI